MPLTKQQAEAIADSLLASAGGASDATQSVTIKAVPWFYRSRASKRLDAREEWLIYREVAHQPFNRNAVFVGVMLAFLAAIFVLFWFEPHHFLAWAFGLLALPPAVRMILVREDLARMSARRA